MADIGPEVQRELLAVYGSKLKADVAKIPHHGGESIASFVQAVHPKRAILSVGPNPYGLPKEEVLEMYRRVGAHLHRTDLEGTITITSDGRLHHVRTERSP
jgi:competence protein ComEC